MPADRLLGGGGVPGGELLTDRLVLLIGTLREGHVVEGTGNKAQLLVVKLLIDARKRWLPAFATINSWKRWSHTEVS